MADFTLTSPDFEHGEAVPRRNTCEGDDVSPRLAWSHPPDGARSLALVVDDPDAPRGTFTHWLAWGLDPAASGLDEGQPAPGQGTNDFGSLGYRGPCPPPGHGPHRYFFRLYALDTELDLAQGADRRELERALARHALATAELMGMYER